MDSKSPIVGVSLSKIVASYSYTRGDSYNRYVICMADIINYLTTQKNAYVLFISHVIEPWGNDDRTVVNDVLKLVKNRQKCLSISEECTAEELKGLIGHCDLFIGARMHTTIASVSMGVPTIAISYSNKTRSIIGDMLGQQDFVININELNYEMLKTKIDIIWNKRSYVKDDLVQKVDSLVKCSENLPKLVRTVIENCA